MSTSVPPPVPPYAPVGQTAPAGIPHPTYAPPIGFAPPLAPAPAPARRSSAAGVIALVLGVIALVAVPIAGAVWAYDVGRGVGSQLLVSSTYDSLGLEIFTPVRDAVLGLEVSFWLGTIFGTWAIVQGIVAAVRGSGRAAGIIAIVLGAIAPMIYVVAVWSGAASGIAAMAGGVI